MFTVVERSPVYARNGLSINSTFLLNDHPAPDVLVIPGVGGILPDGKPFGGRREVNNPAVINWIRRHAPTAEIVLSVCTRAFLLTKGGLLNGLTATTHFKAEVGLRTLAPNTTLAMHERWVDNGRLITSAGVSAGIDVSLHVVGRLLGEEAAIETAAYMQYTMASN